MPEPIGRDRRLEDIRVNPKRHDHTLCELESCCTFCGVVDLVLMRAHFELQRSARGNQ